MYKKRLINLIEIPKLLDDCYLHFAEVGKHIPFNIKRVFFITEANTKLHRGLHTHKKNKQVIFCIQGSIRLELDNGKIKEEIMLDKPNIGVLLDRMIWHKMSDFKKNTILLILASHLFQEEDYIRDYDQFKKTKKD